MSYRTYLVAMVAQSQEDVMDALADAVEKVDSWWIAEDDRADASDTSYDSAIFVPQGSQADMAAARDAWIVEHTDEWAENGYPYADTSGQWYR